MTRRPPNPFGTPQELPPAEDDAPGTEPVQREVAEPPEKTEESGKTDEHRPPSIFRDAEGPRQAVESQPHVGPPPTETPDAASEPETPSTEPETPSTEPETPSTDPAAAQSTEPPTSEAKLDVGSDHSNRPTWPEAPAQARETAHPGRLERGNIPVFDTLREAARIVIDHRGTILLPLLAVTVPVAAIASVVTTLLFLTVWSDRPVITTGTLTTDAPAGMIFVLVLVTAVEALFAQVARGASIVAIAGSARGKPPTLTEALDPAFTRIGGILVLVAVVVMIVGIGLLTIIGLVVMPYLLLRLAIAFDVYMVEGGTPWQALGRSWSLMQGNMIRLLGLLALAAICVLPFFVIISFIGGEIDGGRNTELLLLALWGVVQAVLIVPIVAFFTACTTLYYLKTKAIEDGRGTA